jgi:hypothetical protein
MNDETHRIFTTRGEFIDALRLGFTEAARVGCREIHAADPDFADWPLGEPAVLGALTRWALSHRRLTLHALDFDGLRRRHPRFVDWRRQWSHVIDCRQVEEVDVQDMPTVLLAPGALTVRLFDRAQWRGSLSVEVADAARARELVDAISQRSVDAFPATTLGL